MENTPHLTTIFIDCGGSFLFHEKKRRVVKIYEPLVYIQKNAT